MIEILTKIPVKITIIIVVENGEPYYFIIICKCKEVPLSLFSYQMLASTLTTDERSIYYNVYALVLSYTLKERVLILGKNVGYGQKYNIISAKKIQPKKNPSQRANIHTIRMRAVILGIFISPHL